MGSDLGRTGSAENESPFRSKEDTKAGGNLHNWNAFSLVANLGKLTRCGELHVSYLSPTRNSARSYVCSLSLSPLQLSLSVAHSATLVC